MVRGQHCENCGTTLGFLALSKSMMACPKCSARQEFTGRYWILFVAGLLILVLMSVQIRDLFPAYSFLGTLAVVLVVAIAFFLLLILLFWRLVPKLVQIERRR